MFKKIEKEKKKRLKRQVRNIERQSCKVSRKEREKPH
jgi:hypothetical protein